MRRSALIMSTVMFVCLVDSPGAQPPRGGGGAAEQELIALDKRLADAESKGDVAAVDRILAADELSTAILENRGVACIGEASKRVVRARFAPREIARIQPPSTARAAFSHLLNVYQGEYVRATVFLLC
jgi:hypothetical protein